MKQRVLTGCAIVAVVILALLLREVNLLIFDALILSLSIMCVLEMNNILAKMGKHNSLIFETLFVSLSQILLVLSIHKKLSIFNILIIELGCILFCFIFIFLTSVLAKRKTKQEIAVRKANDTIIMFSLKKALNSLICFIYPTLLLSFFIVLNHISSFTNIVIGNLALFLIVLTLTIPVFVDTFAMLTGSLFGGKKLCPKISPKKTISGAIGGLVWGIISAIFVYIIFNSFISFEQIFVTLNVELWHFSILGFVSACFCQIGDLFESYLKRKANLKDSGDVLPGHGGFLDRIDSHIFNIVIIFIYCIIIL